MTWHVCVGEGRGEVAFAVFVDDGVSSTLIPRGYFPTEAEAEASEAYRKGVLRWGVETRIVQVCCEGFDGWQICGGREAVIPARLRAKS